MTHHRSSFSRVASIASTLLGLTFLFAALNGVAAQSAGDADADAGHKLATSWCSNCHVIGSEQQRGTSNGAPTFMAIAAMKTTTEPGLHAFLLTSHDRMPDWHLSRNEIDDVVAYIISLRHHGHS